MEDSDVPTEHLHEEIHHHIKPGQRWTLGVALTSALLAALAAITSLKSGHYANEAMLAQIQCADKWSYYQSKSIKAAQLNSKMEILEALGKPIEEKDRRKADEYKSEQEEIKTRAETLQAEAKQHLRKHEVFAKGVTLFQVAIAIAAISVLAQRRRFWFVSMGFGAVGVFFLLEGLLIHSAH